MKKVLIAADDTHGSLAVLEVFRNQVRPPEEVILLHVQRPLGKTLMGSMIGENEMSTLKEMLKDTELQEEMDKKTVKKKYKKEVREVLTSRKISSALCYSILIIIIIPRIGGI